MDSVTVLTLTSPDDDPGWSPIDESDIPHPFQPGIHPSVCRFPLSRRIETPSCHSDFELMTRAIATSTLLTINDHKKLPGDRNLISLARGCRMSFKLGWRVVSCHR